MLRWGEPLKGGGALNREHPAAVAVGGDKVYAFGGMEVYPEETPETERRRIDRPRPGHMDVHVFNTAAMRWVRLPVLTSETGQRPPEVPAARRFHTAVLIGDTVYVWGGYVFTDNCNDNCNARCDCNELYAFNVDTHRWSTPRVSGTVPAAMHDHSACVLNGKVMCVYGAWVKWNDAYQDVDTYTGVYKLDTNTMLSSLIRTGGTAPPISGGHSATVIGTKMFVFGGRPTQGCGLANQFYNLVRVFDTETDSWLSCSSSAQPGPEGRWGHAAFAYNGELYICAGYANYRYLDDVWKFNPETLRWKKVEPKGRHPSGRNRMGSCLVGERVVLFGGVYNARACDDLLILDLSPTLKALCKMAVIQYALERSELPHDIRWELAAMTDDISQITGPIGMQISCTTITNVILDND